MTKSINDLCCEILTKTHDGDDLIPEHLKMLENAVNGFLNEKGEIWITNLHERVMKGYVKPWFHAIKNMTQDLEGFIYWKGHQVEHYSFRNYEEEYISAKELEKMCKLCETKKIKVTTGNIFLVRDELKK